MKLIYLICFLSIMSFSQKKDYTKYHKLINKAETSFYMKNDMDSAFVYYDSVFKSYDFIFVKDIINVAQIAIFSKKPYKKYIELGFLQGLKIEHLKNYPLFKKDFEIILKDKKLQNTYKVNRKKYLDRIDFKYLDWVYKLAIKDQMDKYDKKKTLNNCIRLFDTIAKKGYPGDRIIGVSDSLIFKEIGKSYLDLKQQIKHNKSLKHLNTNDKSLSNSQMSNLLFHVKCSYHLFKDELINQIKLGNIHPREVAFFYDNTYDNLSELPTYCNGIKIKGAYIVWDYPEIRKKTTVSLTNSMREKLFIVSLEVDEKKDEFQKKYGFRLYSGFMGCR